MDEAREQFKKSMENATLSLKIAEKCMRQALSKIKKQKPKLKLVK